VLRGVDLTQHGHLEQIDLLEAEKRDLLMRFMDQVVSIMASAGSSPEAMELIKRLKEVYFIGYAEKRKMESQKAAQELLELSRKVFHVAPGVRGGPYRLTVQDGQ